MKGKGTRIRWIKGSRAVPSACLYMMSDFDVVFPLNPRIFKSLDPMVEGLGSLSVIKALKLEDLKLEIKNLPRLTRAILDILRMC